MYYERGIKEISDCEKICIIGAGASGLAAAISASRAGADVCVLEHRTNAAAKLKLTGNGRCNFSNLYMDPSCYHEKSDSRISHLLKSFPPEAAVAFFESLGLRVREHYGYLYPESENAASVVQAMLEQLKHPAGKGRVRLELGTEIPDLQMLRGHYSRIILACGSYALPKTGSDGSGYRYLRQLAVPYSRVLPALCPLHCDTGRLCKAFPGKRFPAGVFLESEGVTLASQYGEIQLGEGKISGIPVLNLSRFASRVLDSGKTAVIRFRGARAEDLPEIVRHRYDADRLSAFYAALDADSFAAEVKKLSRFDESQVCTGGISLEALTDQFELKEYPGIYVTGEMCDVDGICGGYNLHWAWLTGITAGKAAAL